MMKPLFALLAISTAWAQPALTPPQLGFIQDSNRAFRPVYGIAGNFVLGPPIATQVVSAAFSGSFAWVKTDSALLVLDRQGQTLASMDAPAGPALFAFSQDGAPSLAFLTSTNALLQWNAGSLQQLASFDAAVLSLASPDPGQAALIVQRDDGLWDVRILLESGELLSQRALPGLHAPVLMLATGDLIATDPDGIVLRKPSGIERHIAAQLPENFAFQQMGDGWIQLGNYAARIAEGREQSYVLPEADQ